MQKSLTFLAVAFLLFSIPKMLHSQDEPVQDVSYYLNDSGFSQRKNVIKLNLSSIVYGDLPIYYERALTNSLSVEVGAGIILPYYFPELSLLDKEDNGVVNPIGGTSIWIQPKIYYGGRAPENSYVSIQWRQRRYNLENNEITHTDITANFGYQLVLGKRFIIDYNTGIGFSMQKSKIDDGTEDFTGLSMPIGIRLGIIL